MTRRARRPGGKVEVDELVTGSEIARRLGVTRQWVSTRWRNDPTFPQPIGEISKSLIWRWPSIEGWLEATGWTKRGS